MSTTSPAGLIANTPFRMLATMWRKKSSEVPPVRARRAGTAGLVMGRGEAIKICGTVPHSQTAYLNDRVRAWVLSRLDYRNRIMPCAGGHYKTVMHLTISSPLFACASAWSISH